ncbi:WhiB family transcriptional regulator [Glutamicibacter sp. PS]|uniref:WhiB family transcriptional regulator n=1 Tax=Glutamicibacter sp. PS TaxID=3075634 RepID=UPI00283AD889|nr:WhiB family transcriptional regulator [Glutamicibacter sp. PS]MDR4533232.1 WhiB family transcriptional regulator [Glutamicibacter sp. PS]
MLTRGSASTVKHQPATHSKSEDWREQAACRTYDFKTNGDPWFPHPAQIVIEGREAFLICADCPVREACLDYALEHREVKEGIYGGLSPAQRQSELRRRQKAERKDKDQ